MGEIIKIVKAVNFFSKCMSMLAIFIFTNFGGKREFVGFRYDVFENLGVVN